MENINITAGNFPTLKTMSDNGWVQTDASCNQYFKELIPNKEYEFIEERIVHPITKETEIYSSVMNIDDYTKEQIFNDCITYGYEKEEVEQWLANNENISLILECIFENEF